MANQESVLLFIIDGMCPDGMMQTHTPTKGSEAALLLLQFKEP